MAAMISIAFVLNTIALLANFAAYATPWQYVGKTLLGTRNEGYWGYCTNGKDCRWYFHDGFKPLTDGRGILGTDWFKASVALFGFGIIFHLVAFVLALTHIICCRRKVSYSGTISGFLLFTFILIGIAIIIYGVKMHDGHGVQFKTEGTHFHAAFYLGIVSAALTLFASMMYSCYSCRGS